MKVRIDIDCETVDEILKHLAVIAIDIKTEEKKDNSFRFGDITYINDSNCYGVHECTVVS